ncbi:MAG: hypothetical protein Q4F57_01455 [Weeksellaceae bacterium]|nr:hypothetical protein [Weeksellaceae bacterium]
MKSIWVVNYENNEIKIENTWFHGERLFVNGKLQDEKYSMFSSVLTGHLINAKNEKELIKANLGGFWKIQCQLFINYSKIPVNQIE